MRREIALAVLLGVLAAFVHVQAAEDQHPSFAKADTTESLATHKIVGYLSIPNCNVGGCANGAVAQPTYVPSGGNGGNGAVLRTVNREIRRLKKTLFRKLKRAVRSIKKLKKQNAALKKKEAKDRDALSASISSAVSKINTVAARPQLRGPRGRQGPRGQPGRQGPAGRSGYNGQRGAAGPRGATGPAGPAGRAGPAGPRGPQGVAGSRGAAGPAGPRGATGSKGAPGVAGSTGRNGRDGAPGRQGPAGRNGERGPAGAAGRAGSPGANGRSERGPAGPAGPAGPPGPAGKSVQLKPATLNHPPRPYRIFIDALSGFSWDDAEEACLSNGYTLASYDEICYNRDTNVNKFFMAGNKYIPFAGDGNNAWVYVGSDAASFCKTHQQLNGGSRPGWGSTQQVNGAKGQLVCVGDKPRNHDVVKTEGYSYDMSWDDASKVCEANGQTMCNYLNICPNGPGGKPIGGYVKGLANNHPDMWSPVGGLGDNMWVQVNANPGGWPVCNLHSVIGGAAYGRPGWGAVRDRGAHHGPIYCCGKPKEEKVTILGERSSGKTWTQVEAVCKTNMMALCNYNSVCPNGRDATAALPRRNYDDWVAIQDNRAGGNTWIQIGNGWPQCWRHSEINGGPYGTPGWGVDESRGPYKGEILCCAEKGEPAPREVEDAGTSKGRSWEDAKGVCIAKRKNLCRYSDLCANGPNSAPTVGRKGGDVWIPFDDGMANSWLQIGGAGWPLCLRHSEIQGGAFGTPGWGVQRGSEAYKGPIYCC